MINRIDAFNVSYITNLPDDELNNLDKDDIILIFNNLRSFYYQDTVKRETILKCLVNANILSDDFSDEFINNLA